MTARDVRVTRTVAGEASDPHGNVVERLCMPFLTNLSSIVLECWEGNK